MWCNQESQVLKPLIKITHFYHYHDDQNDIIGDGGAGMHGTSKEDSTKQVVTVGLRFIQSGMHAAHPLLLHLLWRL